MEERLVIRWGRDQLHDFAVRLAERLDVPEPPLTTIVLTGDIIPARCVYERQRNLDDYTAAFEHVKAFLRAADLTVGSLDASISDAGEPYPCEETFNLLAPPRSVEGFVAAGFDVITVATNHAKDCGRNGFGCSQSIRDTLRILRGAGIEPVGGGENITEAHRPAIVERNGVRFAFQGYDDIAPQYYGAGEETPGTAPLSEAALRTDIAAAKAQADVVIVLPQWGVEYTPTPTDRQLSLARVAIEAGATLVIGNHPHVVQGIEAGAGTFIAYALGNFVFDQDWSLETQQGAVLEATFAGSKLLSVSLKPVRIVNMFQATFAEEAEAAAILERMRASAEALEGR
jgi:poly-gamma-glutamate synthesis protein (capsule biosynthesis protein)